VDEADAAAQDGRGAVAVAEDGDVDGVVVAFDADHDREVGAAALGVLAGRAVEEVVVHRGGPDSAGEGDGPHTGGRSHLVGERASLALSQ
jgi:hypothetical protein